MIRKKNQCRTCKEICQTVESKSVGKCFGCRNINEIKRRRIAQWNEYWNNCMKMPETNRIEVIDKKVIRDELLHGKKNFIKSGFMAKDYKVRQREIDRADMVAIRLAIRDTELEKRINWAKINEGMLH